MSARYGDARCAREARDARLRRHTSSRATVASRSPTAASPRSSAPTPAASRRCCARSCACSSRAPARCCSTARRSRRCRPSRSRAGSACCRRRSTAPDGITVVDLVARGRHPYQRLLRQWSPEDERAVRDAMAQTAVDDLADRLVDELSGGQRQRVWLAMALAQSTPLLLLDEPTTFLDIAHQMEVLDLCAELHRGGRTLVAVLHDLNHACRYATHLIAMREGAIVAEGPPAEIVDAELVEAVFGLRCLVVPCPATRRADGRPSILLFLVDDPVALAQPIALRAGVLGRHASLAAQHLAHISGDVRLGSAPGLPRPLGQLDRPQRIGEVRGRRGRRALAVQPAQRGAVAAGPKAAPRQDHRPRRVPAPARPAAAARGSPRSPAAPSRRRTAAATRRPRAAGSRRGARRSPRPRRSAPARPRCRRARAAGAGRRRPRSHARRGRGGARCSCATPAPARPQGSASRPRAARSARPAGRTAASGSRPAARSAIARRSRRRAASRGSCAASAVVAPRASRRPLVWGNARDQP